MILHYVKQWEERKHLLEQWLTKNEPNSYENIYEMLFHLVITRSERGELEWDWNRFVKIDDGEYQGNQIFILCSNVYQPELTDYIFTSVAYGSCIWACDTLQAIQESEDKAERVKGYMTLALHMVQETKSFNTNRET
jgi:hypothetical protein